MENGPCLSSGSEELTVTLPLRGELQTGYAFDPLMLLHEDPIEDHPEGPHRLEGVISRLTEKGLLAECQRVILTTSINSGIKLVHNPDYVDFMASINEHSEEDLLMVSKSYNSVYLCPKSFQAASIASSCARDLAVAIANSKVKNGFALIRPPGHHAESHAAMGFCIFNNVAVAAKSLLEQRLAQKVLIVDWDIHHGNGTQKIFASDPNVLFISIHRHDYGKYYPISNVSGPSYVGEDPALGRTVNIGWNEPGMGDSEYLSVFSKIIMPIAWEFNPEFVIVSAGFDAADGDPIGDCKLTPRGYAQMTHMLMGLASGKVMLALEGGYNVPVISVCVEACLRTLMGEAPKAYPPDWSFDISPSALDAINETIKYQSNFWSSLHPKSYKIPESPISLNDCLTQCWSQLCQTCYGLLPLSLQRSKELSTSDLSSFSYAIHASKSVFDTGSRCIVLYFHEAGVLFHENLSNNMVAGNQAKVLLPQTDLLQVLQKIKCSVIDVTTPSKAWKLKQASAGSKDELEFYRNILMQLWDKLLNAAAINVPIFLIGSGILSYTIPHLLENRPESESLIGGIVIFSPTLFIPVMSPEKAEWYKKRSLIFLPTRRPIGTAIPTNAAYGNCVSSGTDSPNLFHEVITSTCNDVENFINDKLRKI